MTGDELRRDQPWIISATDFSHGYSLTAQMVLRTSHLKMNVLYNFTLNLGYPVFMAI